MQDPRITDFLTSLQLERDASPHTITAYRTDLADLCVIGVPHSRWGETPLALVVAADGCKVNVEELRDWANVRLDKHQRLSGVEVRQSLPRNPTGKILRRELRAPYWAKEPAS